MTYAEKLTTVYYYDRSVPQWIVKDEPLADYEAEDIRKDVRDDFIYTHQKKFGIPGLLSDEQVKAEVQRRGGHPPLRIIRQKQTLSFLDSFEEAENLPHEAFRGGF